MQRIVATLDASSTPSTDPPDLRCRFLSGATAPATLRDRRIECTRPDGASPDEEFEVETVDGGAVLYRGRGDKRRGLHARARATCGGALLPYSIISLSYILFTTTDGGVRMVVLLHAFSLGFSAMALAGIFCAYEAAGVVVNLLAGMAGSRYGIKATLLCGLTCQLAALALLAAWTPRASEAAATGAGTNARAIALVTASQILNGISKDLTKLEGKTVTKLVTPGERDSQLFKLVAWITAFKNSAKGVGYLLGAVLLSWSYHGSLAFMAVLILAAYPWAWAALDWNLGRTPVAEASATPTAKPTGTALLRAALTVNSRVGWLSAARLLLFASRDLWFEVALPYFLRDPASGIGWPRAAVGGFLAAWIIVYGQVQAHSGPTILKPLRQHPPTSLVAALWAALLAPLPGGAAAALYSGRLFGPAAPRGAAIATLTTLLYTFCVVFAVNSAVHSFLVVRYADGDKVATTVGVYYSSNAAGRLLGTLLSGVLYTYAPGPLPSRFGACMVAAAVFAAAAAVVVAGVPDPDARARGVACGACGPCCLGAPVVVEGDGAIKPAHGVELAAPTVQEAGR